MTAYRDVRSILNNLTIKSIIVSLGRPSKQNCSSLKNAFKYSSKGSPRSQNIAFNKTQWKFSTVPIERKRIVKDAQKKLKICY